MSGQANPGAGDVPLMLCGEEFTLRPSVEACIAISAMASESLNVAVQRVGDRLDFKFICEIVSLGIGATSPALKKQVAEKVFKQGVLNVAADVILYLRTLMNGGQTPGDGDAGRALDLLDRLVRYVPPGLEEQLVPLESLREALIAKMAEVGDETEDPLPESESQLESSTVP